MPAKLTTEEFIKRAKAVHGDNYSYSRVRYVNSDTKIEIICKLHGAFWQDPTSHTQGAGCRKCYNLTISKRAITTQEFIDRAKRMHGNKYDYSRVAYASNRGKVEIVCKRHGSFWQRPYEHWKGKGCNKCGVEQRTEKRTFTLEEFIKKAREIHGTRYDYSQVKYVNSNIKVKIVCPSHGAFWQTPAGHCTGRDGCPKCSIQDKRDKLAYTTEQFITESAKVHNNKYDYSFAVYVNNKTKVEIICPKHGKFSQLAQHHLRGRGCTKCGADENSKRSRSTTGEFINKARQVHGDLYDYSLVDYVTVSIKVTITCKRHGDFSQTPSDHLSGCGCPLCQLSNGEERVGDILTRWGIKFTRQKKFVKCKNKHLLPFDFYFQIGKHYILLEYDGIHHFSPVDYFGGIEHFERTKQNDIIKTRFAQDNGFVLIRIKYTQFNNIESILRDEIEKHTGQPIEVITDRQQHKTKATLFNPIRYKQAPLL